MVFIERFHVGLLFAKCPECLHLIRLAATRELGQYSPWSSNREDARWAHSRYYEFPTEEDYLDALEAGLADQEGEFRYLRIRAWWAANDSQRGDSLPGEAPAYSTRAILNMGRLYDELTESVEGERLLKAELARELRRFEIAKSLLVFGFSEGLRHAAQVICNLAERRQTRLSMVNGDEALTPEEIKAIEQARSRREMVYRELQKNSQPVPCPYCGKLLASGRAKQCLHCKADWHDPPGP
jgi:hypothetical protein